MADNLRKRALNGEVLAGTWLVLASGLTVEIAGKAGFDWAVIDLEHGMGGTESLLVQMQAADTTPMQPVVRVAWNEPWQIKRVLDLGPYGVMVPMVNTAAEARKAVAAMRYPPAGMRGLTTLSRPADFAASFPDYFRRANEELMTIVQVETQQAVENAAEMAAVDGVDCLFIGPMDLSLGMGLMGQFDHPKFRECVARVVAACKKAKKAAGILIMSPDQIDQTIKDGFTFIAIGSDGGEMATAMRRLAKPFEKFR